MMARNATSALALMLGFGLATAVSPAVAQSDRLDRQDAPAFCDNDGNGYISVTEAKNCAERGYTEWKGDEEAMTADQFVVVFADAVDAQSVFDAADADGDGRVTQAEWTGWHEQAFADKAQGAEVSVEEYEVWYLRGMAD